MKKLTITIAIVLGMTIGVKAQQYGGGLFERGYVSDEVYFGAGNDYYGNRTGEGLIVLPNGHGETDDQNGTPLGSGIVMLVGLSAAYAFAKRRKEE